MRPFLRRRERNLREARKRWLAEFEAYLSIEPNGEFADQTRTVVAKIKRALASQANH
jgi:hypothetical protein